MSVLCVCLQSVPATLEMLASNFADKVKAECLWGEVTGQAQDKEVVVAK